MGRQVGVWRPTLGSFCVGFIKWQKCHLMKTCSPHPPLRAPLSPKVHCGATDNGEKKGSRERFFLGETRPGPRHNSILTLRPHHALTSAVPFLGHLPTYTHTGSAFIPLTLPCPPVPFRGFTGGTWLLLSLSVSDVCTGL